MRALVGAVLLVALFASSASAASPAPIVTTVSLASQIDITPNATGTTHAVVNMSVDCAASTIGWTGLSIVAEAKPIDPAIDASLAPASGMIPFLGCGLAHAFPLDVRVSASHPIRSALVLYANVTAVCSATCTSGSGGTARVLAIVARDAPLAVPTPSPTPPLPSPAPEGAPSASSKSVVASAPLPWIPFAIGAVGLAAAGGGYLALRPKRAARPKAPTLVRGYDAIRSLSPSAWLATDRASGARRVLVRVGKERAKLFRGLEHPNLARVLDVQGEFVIAEEIQGEPVDSHDRVARALAYLDAQGISGVDPDLHEILLCEDGIVRLAATCFASNTGRR